MIQRFPRLSGTPLLLAFTAALCTFANPAFPQSSPPATGTGLKADYYSNNTLSGSVALSRTDSTVNFEWGQAPPASTLPADKFSVRWSGKVEAPATGTYTFFTRSDDGVRLWVDGKLLITNWTDHGAAYDQSVPVTLNGGQRYDLQMEYYESKGNAVSQLLWSYGNQPVQIIPQQRLYPVAIPILPAPPATSRVWLSDVPWVRATSGWGPVELDRSNAENLANDGKPLTIGGIRHNYGLGVHSHSDITYAVFDRYDMFKAVIGVDDEVGDRGSVIFEVYTDGRLAYRSPIMRGNMPGLAIEVPIENVRELRLVVNNAGDNIDYDHADWASARFEGVESVRYITSLGWKSATNGLGPAEKDRANGTAEAKDGERIKLRGIIHSRGLGTYANSEIIYDLDKKYERFNSFVGVDDSAKGAGSVIFEIWGDANRLYRSEVLRSSSPPVPVSVSVMNVELLKLKVLDAGDGNAGDFGVWASAHLLMRGTDAAIPPPPTGISAVPGDRRVTLSWQPVDGAVYYALFRSTTQNGPDWQRVGGEILTTTYTNSGLTNGTPYFYRLRSGNGAGLSDMSAEVGAIPVFIPPGVPANLTAAGGMRQITLNWLPVPGASSYRIYRGSTSNGQSSSAIASANTNSYTNTNLPPGTTYFYKVTAIVNNLQSTPSNEASATTAVPGVPTNLTATPGDRRITLNWSPVEGASGYKIFRSSTSNGQGSSPLASVSGATYTNTNLPPDTKYFYKVAAIVANVQGALSSEVSATTNSVGVPGGLTATPGDRRITLTWSPVTGASSYKIFRGTTPNGQGESPIASVSGTTYTNTNLAPGTKYYYRLAAVVSGVQSALSAEVSATTNAPGVPTNVTATPGTGRITIAWAAVSGASSYKIFRGTTSNGQSETPLASVSGTSYTNTELPASTTYFYKVASVVANVQSALSMEVSATTTAPADGPANLTAAPGDRKVTLTWNAVPNASSYRIFRGTTSNGQGTTHIASTSGTTYANTGLTNGTTYFYKVAAMVNSLQGNLSAEASATPTPPPTAPTGLSVTSSSQTITISWAPVSGATSYRVYRGIAPGAQDPTPVATNLAVPTFVNTGLVNGTNYFFRVSAVNASGEGPRSIEVSGNPTAPQQPVDPATLSAWRLLRRATWGPRPGDVERVRQIGTAAFLNEQFAAPMSEYPDPLFDSSIEVTQEHFMRLGLIGADQLRQRVAWALHKIWVVSAVEVPRADAIVVYQRILMNRAFGNYRQLMSDMTYNPAMGTYLNMLNNRSQQITGAEPNENYARELLQLFTTGIPTLSPGGTPLTDPLGQQIPAYTEEDVKELARIFTGWTFGDGNPATIPTNTGRTNYRVPMEVVDRFHDNGTKTFLGQVFPAGVPAQQEAERALDIIFAHPNLPIFVSKQLIQMLVRSNPSAQYVADVAAVFANNGAGVRGDMQAVVRAILTHPEAQTASPGGEKLMEPALFVLSQMRTFNANVADHPFMTDLSEAMGQRVFYPPSVFSYYSPGFRIRGTNLTAPEFQGLTSVTSLTRTNFVANVLANRYGNDVTIDYTAFNNLAADPAALTDYVARLFLGGQMSAEHRAEIINAINVSPVSSPTERVRTALYLVLASAQYQVDR